MRRRLSEKQQVELYLSHGGICHCCKIKIETGQPWDVEHIIPLAMGGDDELPNMAPAHRACHSTKTKDDVRNIAKAKRRQKRHIGVKKPRSITGWQNMRGEPVRASRYR